MPEVKSADAVVIGGGVRGCSIALFLARAGVRVVLVERRTVGDLASTGNGAQVNVTAKEPDHYTAFSLRSARMYPEFIASLEADVFLQQEGLLFATIHPKEMEEFRKRVEIRNRIPGLHAELLDARAAREILPALGPEVLGGYIARADGRVDVLQLLPAMGRAAQLAGAVILRGTEVTGIEVAGNRVQKVLTTQGAIATPVVVNAAGVHVPHIGRMVGVTIPVEAEHGHMAITQPAPPLLPIPTQHVAQWPSGAFTIGTTNKMIGYDNAVRPGWLSPFLGEALHLVPALKTVNILRVFAHLRPLPPDRLPIYDRAAGLEGFYIVVGHSGITLAPLTGKLFADWIVTGKPDKDLAPYSLSRFEGGSRH
ncbi:MAG TPA: FAD-binding oxidoreductase [Candidatus Methylomirabilis sp.]|nr:FAD-binding oxidoreductase [Candidatus Methylomirabilis sp.]